MAVYSVLALDLGTSTGWALAGAAPRGERIWTRVISGTMSFRPGRFEGGGMRYLRFERWLDELIAIYPFPSVAFEEVRRHVSSDSAHVYGGLLATLTSWCEQRELPYESVPIGTIKKHATGKGNADKKAVIAAMQALGHKPDDDNEADALALLHYVLDPNK